jgi:hypothetical protein
MNSKAYRTPGSSTRSLSLSHGNTREPRTDGWLALRLGSARTLTHASGRDRASRETPASDRLNEATCRALHEMTDRDEEHKRVAGRRRASPSPVAPRRRFQWSTRDTAFAARHGPRQIDCVTRYARQARLSRRSVALGVIGPRDVPEIRATQGRANHEHSPPRSPKARRAKQRAESGDCLRAPRRGQRRVWRNARQLCDRGPAVLLQEYSSHRSSTTSSQGCEQQMSTLRPREARLGRGRSRYPLR